MPRVRHLRQWFGEGAFVVVTGAFAPAVVGGVVGAAATGAPTEGGWPWWAVTVAAGLWGLALGRQAGQAERSALRLEASVLQIERQVLQMHTDLLMHTERLAAASHEADDEDDD